MSDNESELEVSAAQLREQLRSASCVLQWQTTLLGAQKGALDTLASTPAPVDPEVQWALSQREKEAAAREARARTLQMEAQIQAAATAKAAADMQV